MAHPRNFLRPAMRAVLAACIGFAATAFAADPAAHIVKVEGKGEYREASQTSWRQAAPQQPLFATNFVRTLDLSKMAILFSDRTQLQLAQNSTLQIKEVASDGQGRTVVNLNRGRSWTQSKTTPHGLTMETPSALAAIRGTDWEMSVDDEGRATLAVFSGEVEFYNEHGNVLVGAHEQALAEKGRAPVKLRLQVSRSRIQWVSAFTIDPSRHPNEDLAHAYQRLRSSSTRSADDELLLGDIEIYRGDIPAATEVFTRAASRFPRDERFDVALARTSLLSDDAQAARRHAHDALAKRPDSVDALVVLGEIERRDGRAGPALEAYGKATTIAAKDPRGWHGLGVVETERENVRSARSHLENAIALDPTEAATWGELGTLEGFAGNLGLARERLRKALALQPDDYVALTGLGVVELKAGHIDAALDALLRASLIEPRYARAHLYLAAAYYQQERVSATLEELRRAAEMDPKDPLPHLLQSIVYLDRLDPVNAWEESRLALERIPYLKSLNQVADNQKGVANIGFPLAFMGLEAWARSAAHDSYLPFWGGSHFFLADRYPGDFDRRSELMQGFITDPLAFGASNRFQTLLPVPGHHGTIAAHYSHSDDLDVYEPVVTLNGYDTQRIPFAYFAEAIQTRIEPGNLAFSAHGPTYTFALGAKPMHELSVFLYANHVSIDDSQIGRPGETGELERISGNASRIDVGARYAPDARSSIWVKAGHGRENARASDVTSVVLSDFAIEKALLFRTQPIADDVSLRHTIAAAPRMEVTWGLEGARRKEPSQLQSDSDFHFTDTPIDQQSLELVDRNRSEKIYALARWGGDALRIEAGGGWGRYRFDRQGVVTQSGGEVDITQAIERRRFEPMAGVVWRPVAPLALRAACRRWVHPASLDTLMPVAVAAMPIEDQLVFAGGELEQCRGQADWSLSDRTFASAFVERAQVHNMVDAFGSVLNTGTDITNLDRLRNRALSPPPKPDQLEDTPVFGEGVARRANVALERILGRSLALGFNYTYSDTENTASELAGRRIPYIPRHQGSIGATWAPGWRTYVTLAGVYRTKRFGDEANLVVLPPGWDAQFAVYAETPDKHWSVEVHGVNLLKKEFSDVFSVLLSYRF